MHKENQIYLYLFLSNKKHHPVLYSYGVLIYNMHHLVLFYSYPLSLYTPPNSLHNVNWCWSKHGTTYTTWCSILGQTYALYYCLWQSENELENMLKSYTSTKYKIEDLKSQIKFRKEVLLQKAEAKETFNFSKKKPDSKSRLNLSVDELTTNLKILIRQAIVKDKDSNQKQHMLVGKRVRHNFKSDSTSIWYTGKVISQVISLFQSIMYINVTTKIRT